MQEAIDQAAQRPCPECGGPRVITKSASAGLLISTGVISSTVTIPVSCTQCGYTAIFAAGPDKIRDHYLKQ